MKRALVALAASLALGALPRRAAAYAEFEIVSADDPGEGFNDPTPVAPVGGNTGTTLGEQRLIALQHAADLWGEVIDSEVPIVVEAVFEDIGCTPGQATTLAFAGSASLELGISGDGGNPAWFYPVALANRLEGSDLRPDEPDIVATFNDRPGIDCQPGTGWYYGLDARHGNDADMVDVALHELGHGLGFNGYVDQATGALINGTASAFLAHLYDLDAELHYDEMTDAERLASLTNARKVVWDGDQVTADAPSVLEEGTPTLSATPAIAGLTGLAGDATFGGPPLAMSVSAELVTAPDGCPLNDVAGKIALLSGGCAFSQWATGVEANGAVGVLLELPTLWDSPPSSLEQSDPEPVRIPVLSVSVADAARLTTAAAGGAVTVHLSHTPGLRGADAGGRVLMNATAPATTSSLSHWDVLARPNLLMEPFEAPHTTHGVDLARALLIDIGWTPFCGNGRLDQEEGCDDAEDNSDDEADACRTDCTPARCGDGVEDDGETCDDGDDNSDLEPDACRSDCMPARCGDGVEDDGEPCDDGDDNSDTEPNACRSDCTEPRCGDGVADRTEDCDDADANSDTAPDACRADCTAARCGDGVMDQGELCDRGDANSDTTAGACRTNCMPARCGDGVMDQGEACDDGPSNSATAADACRPDCTAARCGDGVVDAMEACDTPGDPTCAPDCSAHNGPDGAGGNGDSSGGDDDSGCGCRVLGANPDRDHGPAALWLLVSALAILARRRRKVDLCR